MQIIHALCAVLDWPIWQFCVTFRAVHMHPSLKVALEFGASKKILRHGAHLAIVRGIIREVWQ